MKRNPLAFLFLPLLLLGGCLEFDAQDVAICYDAKADRIDIHVIYRGLFAEGGPGSTEKPLEKALKDLADVRERGEFLFWNNWPVSVDLTREHAAPIAALLAHVDVENGSLFTDPRGILCANQFVRIRDSRAFVQKLNTLLEVGVQAKLLTGWNGYGPNNKFEDDTRECVREFLRSGQKMLVVEPGRIEVRLPCSPKDHVWLKGQIEQHFMHNMPREVVRRVGVAARRVGGGEVTDTSITASTVQLVGENLKGEIEKSASYRFFWDNEFTIQRDPELTVLGLGMRGAASLQIKKASEGLYHDALLTELRAKGETIEDGLPDQELVRRFDVFHGRDAVLPPKLAALRKQGTTARDK